jgi:hypothetical protein
MKIKKKIMLFIGGPKMLNISKYNIILFFRPPKQSETVLEMEPLPKVEKEQVSISSTF